MILLLKEEYRVKGLKRLLGIEENGYLIKNQPAAKTALAPPDELANKVEVLNNILQQMMQTGLFNMQQDNETGAMHITISQDYLAQNIKLLSAESTLQLSKIQNRTEKIQKEQEGIKQQIQDIKDRSKVDIAIKIRERQIESNVNNKLRNEALREFMKIKNGEYSQNFSILHNSKWRKSSLSRLLSNNIYKNICWRNSKNTTIKKLICHSRLSHSSLFNN